MLRIASSPPCSLREFVVQEADSVFSETLDQHLRKGVFPIHVSQTSL